MSSSIARKHKAEPRGDNGGGAYDPKQRKWKWLCISVLFAALVCLVGLTLRGPARRTWDEVWHLARADSVLQSGFTKGFEDTTIQSAVGPLYVGIHWLVSSWTHLQAPGVRVVNLILFIPALFFVGRASGNRDLGAASGLVLLAVPFFWPVAGLALTEAPTLLAMAICIGCCRGALGETRDVAHRGLLAFAAGLALGSAILGRQLVFISVIPLAGAMFWKPDTWRPCAIIIGTASLFLTWYFVVWGGLLPPNQEHVGRGLRYDHLVLGLAYTGIGTIFIAPRWLFQTLTVTSGLILALLGGFLGWYLVKDFRPGAGVLPHPVYETPVFQALPAAAFGALALIWLWRISISCWEVRHQPFAWSVHGMALLFGLSAVTISHQFSSRYALFATALMPIIASTHVVATAFTLVRICIGAVIGMKLLTSYWL